MRKEILFEKKIFDPKNLEKRDFWAKNGEKWQSQKILVEKIFLVGIDSE